MNTKSGWIPLFDPKPSNEAAVKYTGSFVDEKDGVMTRRIETTGKQLQLIIVAVFDHPNPGESDRPKIVFWLPLTIKGSFFVFHFRKKTILENENGSEREEHIFFRSDDGVIKGLFDKDPDLHWQAIANLRRTKLDHEFEESVRKLLDHHENVKE